MTVGIVGLGLIGGSMAKAYKKAGHTVFAYDISDNITQFAIMDETVQKVLDKTNLSECELILLAVYPQAAVEYLSDMAQYINTNATVIDLCGTKRYVCEKCFQISKNYGFTFIGGHPMAGTHNSGYKYSSAELFLNAPMVIVPPVFDDMALLDNAKKLLEPAGFEFITATTAQNHDKVLAFTSQLAHVVSNAFIKSPTAGEHIGFSAGSYKDLTRVAWLNPDMWTELFLDNKDNLLCELDTLINNLIQYKQAIQKDDSKTLRTLLDEGRKRKEEVDGR